HLVERQQNDAILHFGREGPNRGSSGIARSRDPAGFETDPPVMQRASDGGAADDAVGQRSAAVRTAILHREEPVAGVEDGHRKAANIHGAALTGRNGCGGSDANPVHTNTVSMGWISTNCEG